MLEVTQRLSAGELILADDNLASLQQFNKLVRTDVSPRSPINKHMMADVSPRSPTNKPVGADLSRPSPIYRPRLPIKHVPFHEYTLHETPATIDVATLNILY